MGAIADGIIAFAQPLIDKTDGSLEQMNKALALSQCCWNLALRSEDERDEMIREMRPGLDMDDEEFDEFRNSLLEPMIERHKQMFPFLHMQGALMPPLDGFLNRADWRPALPERKYVGTDAYAPCPCNSGKKFKFCCRKRSRRPNLVTAPTAPPNRSTKTAPVCLNGVAWKTAPLLACEE
jgi:hypothetical protein